MFIWIKQNEWLPKNKMYCKSFFSDIKKKIEKKIGKIKLDYFF